MQTQTSSVATSTKQLTCDGSAWAAILATAIGCFAYGIFIDLSEGSKKISAAFNFYKPSGDLSGKTTIAIGVWIIAWIILHLSWKNRQIKRPGKIIAISVVLILLSLLAAFPPFFNLFAAN